MNRREKILAGVVGGIVANDTQAFVGALTEIACEHLVGWVSENWDRDAALREIDNSRQRAKSIGATR